MAVLANSGPELALAASSSPPERLADLDIDIAERQADVAQHVTVEARQLAPVRDPLAPRGQQGGGAGGRREPRRQRNGGNPVRAHGLSGRVNDAPRGSDVAKGSVAVGQAAFAGLATSGCMRKVMARRFQALIAKIA